VPLALGVLLTPLTPTSAFRSAIAALSVAALLVGVLWQRPDVPTAWRLLILGSVINAVATWTGAAMLFASGTGTQQGWYAPALFALSFPAFIAGLALLGRLGGRVYVADTLDATVVALATFLLLFGWILDDLLPADAVRPLAAAVYPLGSLLLLAMVIRVALSIAVATVALRLLLVSMLCFVAATMSMLVTAFTTGSVQDNFLTPYLLTAASILRGSAGLHPSLSRTRERTQQRHESVSKPRMVAFAVLAVAVPVALVGEISREGRITTGSVVVALLSSGTLLVLLVGRLGLTAGDSQRRATELAERSNELAEALTEQQTLQRQLRHQAMHDPLTGLPNRLLLGQRMEWALNQLPDLGPHSLALIDLDRFKDVNDTYGHSVGDELLVQVSHRLLAQTPKHATLARLGGDEFAVLLQDTPLAEARAWAEQVRLTVRQPYRVGDQDMFISTSVGLFNTASEKRPPTPAEALRDADLALYASKAAGRDRVAIFHPQLRTARMRSSHLMAGLRRALAHNELDVHYQPVVDMATGRVVAVEALLRWNTTGTPTPPSEFIPIAEETGLIGPLGKWVLDRACREAQPWHEQHGLAVSVNVSARQLDDPEFANQVVAALHEASLPGRALILEVTESSLVATSTYSSAVSHFKQLRSHGVRMAIDDFGTGYSSLAYLHHLPIDIVKLDSSFVQQTAGRVLGAQSWAFTRAILNMINALRLQAVAEGVETAEQARALRQVSCPLGQGFLFARPMTRQALNESLATTGGRYPQ
jgi:diguanylate cyclase (GGDEF)-like protein